MGGGKPATQTQTQTQETKPWAEQAPYLTELFAQARQQLQQPIPSYVPTSATTQQAQETAKRFAVETAPQTGEAARAAWQAGLAAPDVMRNPALAAAIQGAIRPLEQQFAERTLPAIRGEATAGGQYGGSRQGIAEGLAARGLTEATGDITADMLSRAYESGLRTQMQALGLTPTVQTAQLVPADILSQIGGQETAEARAAALYPYQQEAAQLQAFQNLISGQYGGTVTGTGVATAPGARSSPLSNAAGGAAIGFSITKEPWGAAIGALSGLVLGGL